MCLLYACVMVAEGTGRSSVSATTRTAQQWHGDGGHIFEHSHQPPHCINVFVPLDDLTDANGPTEFVPGTHVLHAFGTEVSSCSDQHGSTDQNLQTSFAAKAKAGGVVMFDYRLKHRGGLNDSPNDRLLLCLCYAKPWFQDQANPVRTAARSLLCKSTAIQLAKQTKADCGVFRPSLVPKRRTATSFCSFSACPLVATYG